MKAERAGGKRAAPSVASDSPFAAVAALMRWETFHMVQVLWMGVIDLPVGAAEKDWGLQVGLPVCHPVHGLALTDCSLLSELRAPHLLWPAAHDQPCIAFRGCHQHPVALPTARSQAGRHSSSGVADACSSARPQSVLKLPVPQHAALGLFKEMLFTLDLAQQAGTKADRQAAQRLQHRSASQALGLPPRHPLLRLTACSRRYAGRQRPRAQHTLESHGSFCALQLKACLRSAAWRRGTGLYRTGVCLCPHNMHHPEAVWKLLTQAPAGCCTTTSASRACCRC